MLIIGENHGLEFGSGHGMWDLALGPGKFKNQGGHIVTYSAAVSELIHGAEQRGM